MAKPVRLKAPVTDQDLEQLEIGEKVLISGVIYTARDAAHKRLVDMLSAGKPLPADLKGQILYYVGPSPAPPGKPVGAAGPTTAYRMDSYAPTLMKIGLKVMIGKGKRAPEVIEAMKKYKAIYVGATGGAGALISKCIKEVEVLAFPELGPEAFRRMVVEDLPGIVINDIHGNDLYEQGVAKYRREAGA